MERSSSTSVWVTSSLIICLIVVAAAPAVAAADEEEYCASPTSVEAACRGASETHHGVAYDHCVASLAGDPRSKEKEASSIHGLAMLATRMAIDHAASTEAKINDLAELDGSSSDDRFNHCLEQYGGAADLLRDALDNLKARIYGTAMEQLSAALGAAESCEDAWKDAGVNPPVAAHDREYGRMAHIAIGFTHAAA
uniref:Pectinesterase inhibitor domain-containing protein n=1 Tax=Leersia perrieri TaxID=77586 RepID=A0A0D9VB37_9ORYZ